MIILYDTRFGEMDKFDSGSRLAMRKIVPTRAINR